jgi:hypothetical protein
LGLFVERFFTFFAHKYIDFYYPDMGGKPLVLREDTKGFLSFQLVMFKVILIKECDKITHFDNSDNDFCDNVITSDIRGGQKFEEKRPKVRGQINKSSGILPLSDFAFFGVLNTKNAKSDRGSVPELLPPDNVIT